MTPYYTKQGKCWMCGRTRETSIHHVVPKILRKIVKVNKFKVTLCKPCHAKLHLLLPKFFSDGSYRWYGEDKFDIIHPEWEDWSEERILEWSEGGKKNFKKDNIDKLCPQKTNGRKRLKL